MRFEEIGVFDVVHKHLAWPWVAINVSRTRFAFASSENEISTRVLDGARIEHGPTFRLPQGLVLPGKPAPAAGHRGAEAGIHGFSLSSELLAVTGVVEGKSVLVTLDPQGEQRRSRVDELTGGDFTAHALAFDRSGARLWISAENGTQTALMLVDARTHALVGVVESEPFPPPSFHELHVHPQDDAVLLLAACGQDGTFARVVGFTDGPPVAIPTALDQGAESAGFVGFSSDGARVHMVESDALRTHAWPGLYTLSTVNLADGFSSSYSGVVLGHRILIDGTDTETGDSDLVMHFDPTALRGVQLKPPAPSGMWVGRLGADAIVTVESKGDPARGRVIRLPAPEN
ncbi:MAG: hypothetical protein HY898_18735 [Deltaproteobacteria bacterium]|nr:hypothetical protein [Deltaproteobacteria bacterium]